MTSIDVSVRFGHLISIPTLKTLKLVLALARYMCKFQINENKPMRNDHLPLTSLTRVRVLPQEPGRIEYYNQLFCLCGHLGGVSEIQTSLDVSDL